MWIFAWILTLIYGSLILSAGSDLIDDPSTAFTAIGVVAPAFVFVVMYLFGVR